LLTFSELWRGPAEHQLSFIALISSLSNISEYGAGITKAVLTAHAWQSLPGIIAKFGVDSVRAILEWIDTIPETRFSVPEAVHRALAEQPS
jgi:hypothetical protein